MRLLLLSVFSSDFTLAEMIRCRISFRVLEIDQLYFPPSARTPLATGDCVRKLCEVFESVGLMGVSLV